MATDRLLTHIKGTGVIAAVRNSQQLTLALSSTVSTIFILSGTIFTIQEMVDSVKRCGKHVFVHVDFLEGLANDKTALDYISQIVQPTGIISTKSGTIKHAKTISLPSIQRFFLIDSQSYVTMTKTVQSVQPDIVEIMPALMPGMIHKIVTELNVAVIAGGLIETQSHLTDVLSAGALAGSTSQSDLWKL